MIWRAGPPRSRQHQQWRNDRKEKENVIEVHDCWVLIRRWTFGVGRWMLVPKQPNAQRSTFNSQRPSQVMTITVTDYLDVISSWCFWSEPTWTELRKRYEDRVEFQ